jgi:hypothetical protein
VACRFGIEDVNGNESFQMRGMQPMSSIGCPDKHGVVGEDDGLYDDRCWPRKRIGRQSS